ncbi:recombinase family protein [Vibrio fluvialis]|nr:recombinase family protein [Vibrio fluvialis]
MMKYGFAVRDNDYDMQIKAIKEYQCDQIEDNASLTQLSGQLQPGDVVVCWRVDKLANTVAEMQGVLDAIHQAGAAVILLQEKLNSATDSQQLLDQVVAMTAKIECR